MKSKNSILAVMFFLTGISFTFAQDIQWGIKAGYNLSSISGEPDFYDVESLSGFHVGGLAEFRLSERFSLQPELLYSREGAKASFEFDDQEMFMSMNQDLKLGYLNLPVMAKFFPVSGLSLQAGPQLGYLVSAKSDYDMSFDFGEGPFTDSGSEDIKEEMKKFAFGVNFGLGYELAGGLFFQGRYHLGLSDIDRDLPGDDEFDVETEGVTNSGFQFSLGYKF